MRPQGRLKRAKRYQTRKTAKDAQASLAKASCEDGRKSWQPPRELMEKVKSQMGHLARGMDDARLEWERRPHPGPELLDQEVEKPCQREGL